MTGPASNLDRLRTRLTAAYRQSSPLEQQIVQLSSILYEPVSRTAFVECLNQAGARDLKNQLFTIKLLKPHLDQLLANELLVSKGNQIECHPLLVEIATRDTVRSGTFEMLVGVVEEKLPISLRWQRGPRYFKSELQLIREVRIGIYRQDIEFIVRQLEDYSKSTYRSEVLTLEPILLRVCENPFDKDWFGTLRQEFYDVTLWSILLDSVVNLAPAEAPFALLEEDCGILASGRCSDSVRLLLTEQLILRGRLLEAQQCVDRLGDRLEERALGLRGWLAFLSGDYRKAIECYTGALKGFKKATGKRQIYFDSIGGLIFVLALLQEGSPERLREAAGYATLIAKQSQHWLAATYTSLLVVLQIQQGDLSEKDALLNNLDLAHSGTHSIDTLWRSLCLYWLDAERAKTSLPGVLEPFLAQAEAAGYRWLALVAAQILARLKPEVYGKRAATLGGEGNIQVVDVIERQESWELSLKALANLYQKPEGPPRAEAQLRLAWFVTFTKSHWTLQPREQKLGANGTWSKGRNLALKRLSTAREEIDYLSEQDRRVCACIRATSGYYGQFHYEFDDKAIAALAGHPLVFWENTPTRIEIVKGEPQLTVSKAKGGQLVLQFLPEPEPDQDIVVTLETPTRLKVIEIKAEHRRIAAIIGARNRLEVPATAEERVIAAINAVSRTVTVHSDIGSGLESAETVLAQARPCLHLLPAGAGLKVTVLSRPFGDGGPYYRPGAGGATVIAEIGGRRLQTTRNLREEQKLAAAAVAACPSLVRQEERDGEWLVEQPEDCLELLLELRGLGEQVALEWPQGEKLRVTQQAGLANFKMRIERQHDWFATEGALQLDDGLVLDMQRLLELLEQTPGRFLPLGEGQFLALTEEFRRRLDELRTFSEKHGKGRRIHPLAAAALEDLVEASGVQADKHWPAHLQRLKQVQSLQPELPSTLQAELRDYQLDGFRWLARLAEWGVGACLADDMGLGKTLQALAVILTRAPAGPTLIVAPTSVCSNWVAEAARFAPTLRSVQLGGGDRQKRLKALQPFDLLVCSYGLLQQEEVAQMLAGVEWQTIVLDEAQAIKNTATRRSQAAMNLHGGFKLLTTGTPIENHLGELWNLFRFINPGLLGSLESFNERFAVPIEKFQDKPARSKLKKLIQPFLLRRTKNQVLEELPPRTEIVLSVELSREEMALYEALRREALAKLAATDSGAGQKHLQVLAEIMKLRRACCNARLVVPDTQLVGAKLQLFGEVLDELLDNHHKALVFSQFVDHLQILRAYLDERQIRYQYLDGSTPAAERKKRVEAFQAGEGDVFLISLKAGGTGLNLTAADYVLHMDPWWNPAVEDQASDRAHRIGQQRPVTIYRLVAKDTIEEKIVDLHYRKRDLADSLLEGTDVSGKVSTEALLQLMSEA